MNLNCLGPTWRSRFDISQFKERQDCRVKQLEELNIEGDNYKCCLFWVDKNAVRKWLR